MKKRFLLIFTIVTMLALALAISVNAEFDKSEAVTVTLSNGATQSCALYDGEGDELVWYTLDDGATVVSVKAKELFFDTKGGKLTESANLTSIYLNAETALQIHNDNTTNKIVVANLRGCTFAGIYHSGYKTTFSNSKTVQYVYLPSTLKSFDCNTFQYCPNLKVCDIPNDASFTITSANNFVGCTSLMEINLFGCTSAKGSIFHSNFSGCTSLTKVIVNPDTIDWPAINGNTFANCPLTQFGLIPGECTIPASTTSLGDNCFQKSKFTTVNLADSQVKSIGYNAFEQNPNLTEVIFPKSLESMNIRVFKDCPSLATLTGLESTKLSTIPQETFYRSCLSTVVLPSSCTAIGYKAFADDGKNISALTSITIPAGITLIDDYAFQNCKLLSSIIFLGDAGENAVIDIAAFENCKALTNVVLPNGIKALNNCAFKNSGIVNVTLPSTLEEVNGGEHFYGTALENVYGFENTKITTVPYAMFRGTSKWTPDVLRLPATVKTINQYGFADCGAKKIILNPGIETIGVEAFVNCGKVQEIYIPDSIVSISNSAFSNNVSKNILFFVVSSDSTYIEAIKAGGTYATTVVDYEAYVNDPTSYTSGKHLIYNVNKCVAFYNGEHTIDENNKIINYANGFASSGTCTILCSTCLKEYTENLNALFTLLGSSVPSYTEGSITIGYSINYEAISKYEELTGKELRYGLFVALQQVIGQDDIFDDEGNKNERIITYEVPSLNFAAFELKLTGFTTDEQKAAKIAMGAYVVVSKDGVNEYSYMQTDAPSNGEKYHFASYNDFFQSAQAE